MRPDVIGTDRPQIVEPLGRSALGKRVNGPALTNRQAMQ
jgi:hypothetical protein